jgi:hypothetical protein
MNRGKWSDPNVPKQDWICIEMIDHHEPAVICQMCEYQTIRYGHVMSHADYPDTLECGCICAGGMEGDEEAARERERGIKRKPRREHVPVSTDAQSWIKAADQILVMSEQLGSREHTFVKDMRHRFVKFPGFQPSEAQTSWFVSIYKRMFMNEPAHT